MRRIALSLPDDQHCVLIVVNRKADVFCRTCSWEMRIEREMGVHEELSAPEMKRVLEHEKGHRS